MSIIQVIYPNDTRDVYLYIYSVSAYLYIYSLSAR